jgi:flagellar motor switch protein FliN/FliY
MQLYPVPLAREMCANFLSNMEMDTASTIDDGAYSGPEDSEDTPQSEPQPMPQQASTGNMQGQPAGGQSMMVQSNQTQANVQPAQFQPFNGTYQMPLQPENIDLIMDVPLDVTVELGRTKKTVQEILDFAPGTIIELNKIAGEPIDVLVNGKFVAKGEVVVIEESFGIRITEIMK